jgi:hypothetical protein
MPPTSSSIDSVDAITTVIQAPPGTELLYDAADEKAIHQQVAGLQHVKKGDSHVLLVPQPSLTDPNDPLLWPSWKKWTTFANALAYSFLGAVTGPIMAAGTRRPLSLETSDTDRVRDGTAISGISSSISKIDICQWSNIGVPGRCDHHMDVSFQ